LAERTTVRSERAIVAALGVSILATVGLIVLYALGGGAQLEGILLALALGGVGAAIVIWAIALLAAPIEVEERHSLESRWPPAAEAATALQCERGRFPERGHRTTAAGTRRPSIGYRFHRGPSLSCEPATQSRSAIHWSLVECQAQRSACRLPAASAAD
jgi:Na+/melibiose symporter-like transporter